MSYQWLTMADQHMHRMREFYSSLGPVNETFPPIDLTDNWLLGVRVKKEHFYLNQLMSAYKVKKQIKQEMTRLQCLQSMVKSGDRNNILELYENIVYSLQEQIQTTLASILYIRYFFCERMEERQTSRGEKILGMGNIRRKGERITGIGWKMEKVEKTCSHIFILNTCSSCRKLFYEEKEINFMSQLEQCFQEYKFIIDYLKMDTENKVGIISEKEKFSIYCSDLRNQEYMSFVEEEYHRIGLAEWLPGSLVFLFHFQNVDTVFLNNFKSMMFKELAFLNWVYNIVFTYQVETISDSNGNGLKNTDSCICHNHIKGVHLKLEICTFCRVMNYMSRRKTDIVVGAPTLPSNDYRRNRYYGIDENVIIDTELFYVSLLTVYEQKKKDGCDIDRGNIDWIMGLHSGRVLQYERYFYFRMKF